MNSIEESSMGAFKARLRKLQSEGVPGDANPGKGRRVDYTIALLIEVAVAVELLQCGWSPYEAAAVIKANRIEFYHAGLLALVGNRDGLVDPLILISPEALRSLSYDAKDEAAAAAAISFVTREKLAEIFGPQSAVFIPLTGEYYRWSVLDLPYVMINLMACIELQGIEDVADHFLEAVAENMPHLKAFARDRVNVLAHRIDRSDDDGGS